MLLSKNSVVKITDFGISKMAQTSLQANTVAGTIPYISPEMFTCLFSGSAKYSTQTDIWSLGCVLYEMLNFPNFELAFPVGIQADPRIPDLSGHFVFSSFLNKFAILFTCFNTLYYILNDSKLIRMLNKNQAARITSVDLYENLLVFLF